jgi:hypothetical protein
MMNIAGSQLAAINLLEGPSGKRSHVINLFTGLGLSVL